MVRVPVKKVRQLRPLMKHQGNFVEWALYKNIFHPACFMEMRLGKTLAAIRLTALWNIQTPILVVAPKTVLESWEKELNLEDEDYVIIADMSKVYRTGTVEMAFHEGRRIWILVNYEALRVTPHLAYLSWGGVYLDESTAIKNPLAQISKLCCDGFRSVEHRMILSGLPSPEGEINLFQQFKFLHGQMMSYDNFYRFRSNYFIPGYNNRDWGIAPREKRLIKEEVHNKAFVLRRQDAGMKDRKIRSKRVIEMDKDQKKFYNEVEKTFSTWIETEGVEVLRETEHVIVQRTWLARIAGGCDVTGVPKWNNKQKELLSLLKGELNDQPVVVFFRFTSEILATHQMLKAKGINSQVLYGDIDREDRKKTMTWFRESRDPARVVLCQLKLVKYGVDLSPADTVIYYSMTYSGEEIGQSEDRVIHPLKDSPILLLYLISKGTVDEDALFATDEKVTTAKMFMEKMNESMLKRLGLWIR